jgi:antitoxin (DNA-binding transcriptional repressor) of toxin-antitoxin stability system
MNTRTVTVEEACSHIGELLARAALGQETIVVKGTQAVARVVPAGGRPAAKRQGLFGCLQGKIVLAPDFDAPLPDFEAYTR